jgi:hypothetical protein
MAVAVILVILAVAFCVVAFVTKNRDLVDRDDDSRYWTDRN